MYPQDIQAYFSSPFFIYSIFLFFGLFSIAGGLLLLTAYKDKRLPYLSLASLGCFTTGIGVILVLFKDHIPEQFAYCVGNGLNVGSWVFFYYVYLGILEKPIEVKRVITHALLIIMAAALTLLIMTKTLKGYEPGMVAFANCMGSFLIGKLVFNLYKTHRSNVVIALLVLFLLNAIIWGIRVIATLFFHKGNAFEGGMYQHISFFVLMLINIARYMFFFGLIGEIEWKKNEKLISENFMYKEELANKKVEQSEAQFLSSLNALAKARDNETGNHIIRTQLYVKAIAHRLLRKGCYADFLNDKTIHMMYRAAPLHDIGKIGIPDNILLKEGRLVDEEWSVMQTHALIGESVLRSAEMEYLGSSELVQLAAKIAGGHHEKWDGTGYPRGLMGQEIPLEARIMAVADVYDALISPRIYKKAWTHEKAFNEICSLSNIQFDPLIVAAFIDEEENFRDISQQYQDILVQS